MQPDIVILGFIYRDIFRNVLTFRDYAKPRFILKENNLVIDNSPVPAPFEILDQDKFHLRFFDLLSLFVDARRTRRMPQKKRAEDITAHILSELNREIRDIKAQPIFLYFPISNEIVSPRRWTEGENTFFSICRDIDDLMYHTLRSSFRERVKAGETFGSGHWGPKAHFVAGEAIFHYLVDHKLAADTYDVDPEEPNNNLLNNDKEESSTQTTVRKRLKKKETLQFH